MENEILAALRDAATALRSGGRGGRKNQIQMKPDRIKEVRLALKLTQEEFADKVGVSVQAVRSWEQGFRKPGALSQIMLAALFSEAKKLEHV